MFTEAGDISVKEKKKRKEKKTDSLDILGTSGLPSPEILGTSGSQNSEILDRKKSHRKSRKHNPEVNSKLGICLIVNLT